MEFKEDETSSRDADRCDVGLTQVMYKTPKLVA